MINIWGGGRVNYFAWNNKMINIFKKLIRFGLTFSLSKNVKNEVF